MKLENNGNLQVFGKDHCFLTGSGTTALYVGLRALKLPKKSLVIVPNICCPDVAYAVMWAGLTPFFVDVERTSLNICTQSLERILREKRNVSCVIAVHLFGLPCKIKEIKEITNRYKVRLVEDCAQALGNKVDGNLLGSFGDFSIFSFGKGKILELGHGGVVATGDAALAKVIEHEVNLLPKYDGDYVSKMGKRHRKLYYFLYDLGRKNDRLNVLYRLFPAFFRNYYLYKYDESYFNGFVEGVKDLGNNLALRMARQKQYDEKLKDVNALAFTGKQGSEQGVALTRYCLLVDDAEKVAAKLRESSIHSNTMYPMLVDRFYVSFNRDDYPNSFYLRNKILNLWTDSSCEKTMDSMAQILISELGKK